MDKMRKKYNYRNNTRKLGMKPNLSILELIRDSFVIKEFERMFG